MRARAKSVFGVALIPLAEHIWSTLSPGRPLPHIGWRLTSSPEPYGLAWVESQRVQLYIPHHRPHLCHVVEVILHELCHCALPPDVEDHGIEFRELMVSAAGKLWGISGLSLEGCESSEYLLDQRLKEALLRGYVEGEISFEGDEGEKPERCEACQTVFAGPSRCCGHFTRPLRAGGKGES